SGHRDARDSSCRVETRQRGHNGRDQGHSFSHRCQTLLAHARAAGKGSTCGGADDKAELSACWPPSAEAVQPLCPCPPDETRSCLHAQTENPVGARYSRSRAPDQRTIREARQVTPHSASNLRTTEA